MKNEFIHHSDGKTTIFIESNELLLEMWISTEDFHILESRGYNICATWDKDSRTWYALSKGERVHRLLKGLSKGDTRQVHHIDGNGLNNLPENTEVLTPSEHARKKCPKDPIVGDPSLGVKISMLSKPEPNKKQPELRYWWRLDVNGIHYGTFYSMTKANQYSKTADMVVNEKATDEQIYAAFLPRGHKEEQITTAIKDIRRFFRTPDPSKQKEEVKE